MGTSEPSFKERRYAQTMSKLTPLAAVVSLAIEAMTLGALWYRPRALAISAIAFGAMMALNVYINMVVLKRWGAHRTETLRLALSVTTSVLTNHYTGWPLPVWLWLPYHGLTSDGHRKWNWIALVAYVVPLDLMALYDHVSIQQPLLFTFLAVAARIFTDARLDVLRTMFETSETQRAELDAAHATLKAEIATREKIESALARAQKLEALGRVASGVAHEINTPVQFVSDSVAFLRDATSGFTRVIEAHRARAKDVEDVEAEVDLDFLVCEAPKAIALVEVGLERIGAIVRSMRQVSHVDGERMEPVDIGQAIKTAVTLATSECKHVADVETRLETLGPVVCHGGEILQVLLNLLVNAAHAIGATGKRGRIVIATAQRNGWVSIDVADTGPGIPAALHERIFEPFFTTKKVGQGTGQGLAIARAMIAHHGGTLTFTTSGEGTTFRVELPADGAARAAA